MTCFRHFAVLICATVFVAAVGDCFAGNPYSSPAQTQYFKPAQKYDPVPVYQPVLPPKAAMPYSPPMTYQKAPYQVAQPVKVCRPPKVIYRHHGGCKKRGCDCCAAKRQTLLTVVDPKCGDRVMQIPVTIPAECMGGPCEKDRKGLFVRGVSTFKWPSGYLARIVHLHNGDLLVHTYESHKCKAKAKAYPKGYGYPPPAYSYPPPSYPSPSYRPQFEPTPAEPRIEPVEPPVELELIPPGGYSL
jgi:hypothetical protein